MGLVEVKAPFRCIKNLNFRFISLILRGLSLSFLLFPLRLKKHRRMERRDPSDGFKKALKFIVDLKSLSVVELFS